MYLSHRLRLHRPCAARLGGAAGREHRLTTTIAIAATGIATNAGSVVPRLPENRTRSTGICKITATPPQVTMINKAAGVAGWAKIVPQARLRTVRRACLEIADGSATPWALVRLPSRGGTEPKQGPQYRPQQPALWQSTLSESRAMVMPTSCGNAPGPGLALAVGVSGLSRRPLPHHGSRRSSPAAARRISRDRRASLRHRLPCRARAWPPLARAARQRCRRP